MPKFSYYSIRRVWIGVVSRVQFVVKTSKHFDRVKLAMTQLNTFCKHIYTNTAVLLPKVYKTKTYINNNRALNAVFLGVLTLTDARSDLLNITNKLFSSYISNTTLL